MVNVGTQGLPQVPITPDPRAMQDELNQRTAALQKAAGAARGRARGEVTYASPGDEDAWKRWKSMAVAHHLMAQAGQDNPIRWPGEFHGMGVPAERAKEVASISKGRREKMAAAKNAAQGRIMAKKNDIPAAVWEPWAKQQQGGDLSPEELAMLNPAAGEIAKELDPNFQKAALMASLFGGLGNMAGQGVPMDLAKVNEIIAMIDSLSAKPAPPAAPEPPANPEPPRMVAPSFIAPNAPPASNNFLPDIVAAIGKWFRDSQVPIGAVPPNNSLHLWPRGAGI